MKTKKHIFALIMFTVATLLTGCSNDDSPSSVQNTDSILNKWWYDSGDFTADIYFHSNGEYEQLITLFGSNIGSSGYWQWTDESAGIMKITGLSGGGQAASEVWFKFSNITEHSFTLQQSTDGSNYSEPFNYIDTND